MLTKIEFRRVVLLVCCIFLVPRIASAEWTFPPIVSISPNGYLSHMVMDSNNKMHITYEQYLDVSDPYSCSIKYVTNASGSWVTATIAEPPYAIGGAEIAIDSLNRPHISWRGAIADPLDTMYATNASGTWVTSIIETEGDTYGGSVAVDSNNKVHLAYINTVSGTLNYATNASGAWTTSTLDGVPPMIGGYRSLVVDSQNRVHIAYCLDNESGAALKYATNASGSWVIRTVDDSVAYIGPGVDMALDSNDKVHISYCEGPAPWTNTVKYATNASGSWVRRTIDPTAHTVWTSIALDSKNKVHISYDDSSLKYATNKTEEWVITVVDNTPIQNPSVTLDSYDNIHIVYLDMVTQDLKYATTAADTLIVNGHQLSKNPETWVRFVGETIVPQLLGNRSNQIKVAARASWWGLKEGTFFYDDKLKNNPHIHSNCREFNEKKQEWKDIRHNNEPLFTCPEGNLWQVGLAAIQVQDYTEQKVIETIQTLWPGRGLTDVLAEVASLAGYDPSQGDGAAIVSSEGYLRQSWLMRHPAVGITLVEPTVTWGCIDLDPVPCWCRWCGKEPWQTAKMFASTKEDILQSISDLETIYDILAPCAAPHPGNLIFQDDFESYAVGTFPSGGGYFIRPGAPGAGYSYQFITNERANSGMKSLRLESAEGLAINVQKLFSPPSTKVAIESFVNTTRDDSTNAFIGFGVEDGVLAAVMFWSDGAIYARNDAFGNPPVISLGRRYAANTWIKVRVELDLAIDRFKVFVGDVLVGDNLPAGEPIDRIWIAVDNNLAGGTGGGTVTFFDDVAVYDISVNK